MVSEIYYTLSKWISGEEREETESVLKIHFHVLKEMGVRPIRIHYGFD